MPLRDIAHARTGDKGNTSLVSLIARDPADYPLLAAEVTAERVKAHFGAQVTGAVTRYDLPGIGALNFVMEGALAGGVTRSLALDAHGKALGSCLLALEVERPAAAGKGSSGQG
ncbi:AtuA-related protein [Phreatobacter sp.]|uniref:AtuA-related protein n=1 Tax=Phreatobacter sp. TaxID=1966341 RepID=UPI003F72C5D0